MDWKKVNWKDVQAYFPLILVILIATYLIATYSYSKGTRDMLMFSAENAVKQGKTGSG